MALKQLNFDDGSDFVIKSGLSATGSTRRQFMAGAAGVAGITGAAAMGLARPWRAAPAYSLATFSADVTPPLGHPLMGGGIEPARSIVDRLEARGVILLGMDKPVVICAIDWCEIRNDAYDRWRAALAQAAGTDASRVLLSSVHQHDTPIADLAAQRMLEAAGAGAAICDLKFHEQAVMTVAAAAREAMTRPRAITHLGIGQAKVEGVASNRRYLDDAGKPRHDRMSATRNASIRARPEGEIDPWLKTLSLWDGDKPLLALSAYSTHPMSHYGKGAVSGDFVAMARNIRQKEVPEAFQMYISGCSGNVTAGKYNDGATANRAVLAGRLREAMSGAWDATRREPLKRIGFRTVPLNLKARNSAGFSAEELRKKLKEEPKPFGRCLAALGLSWLQRTQAGRAIDVGAIDFGPASYLLLPAESYVEYQLMAQKARPDGFVVTAGYGECGPGYIPIERAWSEKDGNLHDWCWVAERSEEVMKQAIAAALRKE